MNLEYLFSQFCRLARKNTELSNYLLGTVSSGRFPSVHTGLYLTYHVCDLIAGHVFLHMKNARRREPTPGA